MSLSAVHENLASLKKDVLCRLKDLGSVEKSGAVVLGCVIGSYLTYNVVDNISRAGRSESERVQVLHKWLRKYVNCGWIYKKRDTFYFPFSVVESTVNYGSYGMVPRPVFEYQEQLRVETEMNQDRWFNFPLRQLWNESLQAVSERVGSKYENLAFITNVTEGVSAILNSMKFDENDKILLSSFNYAAVEKAAAYHAKKIGSEPLCVELTEPILGEDQICDLYESKLKENANIKLAIIDHIPSSTAVVLPIKRMVDLCRKYNVLSLIDGAHAPGQLKLNLEELEADFYVGNLHKWYYAPRGAAIIWVHPKHQSWTDPIVVSHFSNLGFHDRFFRQGSKDYTAYIAAKKAIEYYEDIGGMDHLMWYIPPMVSWAMDYLINEFGTRALDVPNHMRAPFMGIVKMPEIFDKMFDSEVVLKQDLYRTQKVICMTVKYDGKMWLRVSAQLCSTKQDYVIFAEKVKIRAVELQKEFDNPKSGN